MAIVGGGFTGLWTARELCDATRAARRGPRAGGLRLRRLGAQRRLGVGALPRRRTRRVRRAATAATPSPTYDARPQRRGRGRSATSVARRRHRRPLRARRHADLRAQRPSGRHDSAREVDTRASSAYSDRGPHVARRPTTLASAAHVSDSRWRRPTRPTARASTRPDSCAVSPTSSSDSARGSSRTPRSRASPARGATARPRSSRSGPPCTRASWCARRKASRRPCPASVARVAPLYSLMIATEPQSAVVLGRGRTSRVRDLRRRSPPHHLRPTHRGRPDSPSAGAARPITSAPRSRSASTTNPQVFAMLEVDAARALPRA